MYTHYHFRHFSNKHPNPFKTNSSWTPPPPDNPNLLSYITSVAASIQHTFKQHTHTGQPQNSNLNTEEMEFLKKFNIHHQEFVIKPADKGGAIVIWSTTDYEKEALSQLSDKNIMKEYRPTQTPSFQHKQTQSPNMSRISLNMETLTTKHLNIYYRPHHHVHPYSTSYPKSTNPTTQDDQSYQAVIHQQIGSPHS